MNLKQWHQAHAAGLRQTTLGIIKRSPDQICLAMKKRGFGVGNWNFSGGKVEPGETPEDGLIRETAEEFGTQIGSLKLVAILYFYFNDIPVDKNWNQKCFVFEAGSWKGEPQEGAEMKPQWYSRQQIPYEEMWQEDRAWIEPVLDGQDLTGYFLFTSTGDCLEKEIITGQIIDT